MACLALCLALGESHTDPTTNPMFDPPLPWPYSGFGKIVEPTLKLNVFSHKVENYNLGCGGWLWSLGR